MRKAKRYVQRTNINFDIQVYEALKQYCFDKGTTMTDLVNELVKELLKKEGYYFGETHDKRD